MLSSTRLDALDKATSNLEAQGYVELSSGSEPELGWYTLDEIPTCKDGFWTTRFTVYRLVEGRDTLRIFKTSVMIPDKLDKEIG